MARIRSIHPGIFTDEHYMALSLGARELAKGIWCESDDHGVFEWKPNTLKARILPNDAVDMPALFAELVEHQFIRRLTADGRDLGFVRNFCRYQRPKKPKYAHPLPQEFRTWVGLKAESSEPVPPDEREPVPHPSPIGGGKPPQRKEEGGVGRSKDSGAKAPAVDPVEDAFERFWLAHPNRGLAPHNRPNPKKPALERFRAAVRDGVDPEMLVRAAAAWARADRDEPRQTVAQAMTWLSQARWQQYGDAAAVAVVVGPDAWRERLGKYHGPGKFWPKHLGPAPGEPGCRVPPELLAESWVAPIDARPADLPAPVREPDPMPPIPDGC